jgi:hypothetical protein
VQVFDAGLRRLSRPEAEAEPTCRGRVMEPTRLTQGSGWRLAGDSIRLDQPTPLAFVSLDSVGTPAA